MAQPHHGRWVSNQLIILMLNTTSLFVLVLGITQCSHPTRCPGFGLLVPHVERVDGLYPNYWFPCSIHLAVERSSVHAMVRCTPMGCVVCKSAHGTRDMLVFLLPSPRMG